MIKKILIILALIIVVFVIVVATRPAYFSVTRSASRTPFSRRA
jgi:flagellar basal body-associated protein FliL